MLEPRRSEAGSGSTYKRQKLQKLYTHGGATYVSVRNSKKTSNLPVLNVKPFLHSKVSYTKLTLARRKFIWMEALARYKNEIWCMDLAHVDKLAKDDEGVKYLLVSHELFDRTIDAKGMRAKDWKVTARAFLKMISKRNWPKHNSVNKGKNFFGEFWKFGKSEGF